MSKNWYPVIDIVICLECGACTDKCSRGVYDLTKAPVPVVIAPENCKEGCHGCMKVCPAGAIGYIGEGLFDNTDCGCCKDIGRACECSGNN